jgi:hypothetical protein
MSGGEDYLRWQSHVKGEVEGSRRAGRNTFQGSFAAWEESPQLTARCPS